MKKSGKGYRESMRGRHMRHTHSARGMSARPHGKRGRRKGGRY